MKISQQIAKPRGQEAPIFVVGVANEDRRHADKCHSTVAKYSPNFFNRKRRIGEVFQHLRADDEIELHAAKRKILRNTADVHQGSELRVDSNVLLNALAEQRTIGLQAAADIKDLKSA